MDRLMSKDITVYAEVIPAHLTRVPPTFANALEFWFWVFWLVVAALLFPTFPRFPSQNRRRRCHRALWPRWEG